MPKEIQNLATLNQLLYILIHIFDNSCSSLHEHYFNLNTDPNRIKTFQTIY